ncbi:sensor histidine kinase [Millisia brevis]|uniref:sensor histidine kinase n=1 Tax=Millisia brevis TaxID=264148 RepID=UPI0008368A9A|nr:sensor histidine kinase [Millisia brevis]
MRPRLRFATQLLVLQLALVAVVVLVGFALFGWQLAHHRSIEYGERALAIGRTVAADTEVRSEVARWSAADTAGLAVQEELAAGQVQAVAQRVRESTGALFVVIVDDRGIRLAHPDNDEVGRPVSTDPSAALAGREEVIQQVGTLGESARAKVPVFAPGSDTSVVGAVSVGISTTVIDAVWRDDLLLAAAFAAGSLGLGAACSILLTRRSRRLTLGLEPEEMVTLVVEHEAVLGGIADAVVAVDPAGRITVANTEAQRLLGDRVLPGHLLGEVGLPADLVERVTRLLGSGAGEPGTADGPHHLLAGNRLLVWTARRVRRRQRELGVVVSLRDRTDLEALSRELEVARTAGFELRAERHEFANRLHVVHGLVDGGRTAEATEYLEQVLGSGPLGISPHDLDTIADPTLQAFLTAKAGRLHERGLTLRIGPDTWLPTTLEDPMPATVVLGNLVDNAANAAAERDTAAGYVEVEIQEAEGVIHLTVTDSGAGIPEGLAQRIFEPGVSGSDDPGRGLGLALVRQVTTQFGGDVRLIDRGGAEHGAILHATLRRSALRRRLPVAQREPR